MHLRDRRDYHIVVLGAGMFARLSIRFQGLEVSRLTILWCIGGVGKSCLTGKAENSNYASGVFDD